jgi:hypothetical protein
MSLQCPWSVDKLKKCLYQSLMRAFLLLAAAFLRLICTSFKKQEVGTKQGDGNSLALASDEASVVR